MVKILISILSDHIIPNYLFIKEKSNAFDKLIFITTQYVEQKNIDGNLERTLGFKTKSIRRILVEEDNYVSILEKLQTEKFDFNDEYYINQTGGTKVMSIALFEFFRRFNSHFVYIPIGKNIYYNFENSADIKLNYRISLEEYLSLYGLRYECDNTLICDAAQTFAFFDEVKGENIRLSGKVCNAHKEPTSEMRKYYSGAWFEEYTYLRIKEEFKLPDNAIALSAKICRNTSNTNDNEIDVIYVYENILNIIECKVSMVGYGKISIQKIEKYLYKLAAIAKDLGLRVNSYLFTLHKVEDFSQETLDSIYKRANILGIKDIVGGQKLSSNKLIL